MSSQRLRQSSICSASGSARASFRIISELMAVMYRAGLHAQAGVIAILNSATGNRLSAIPR
jgi:hypothetical protein